MNCITELYMSYSNGKLPEETISHGKIIEIVKGLPGVGFKLTDAGDYDIQNKKLRNVAPPETNNDVTTKSYVDNKALLVDGSNKMLGALNMDNRRVENLAPARHGYSDAVSSLHIHTFFFDLNTNDGKIEAQNPIDMKNQQISGVKDPTLHSDASNKFYVDSPLNFKADKTELANYLKKDGSISVTSDFDFGNNKISNLAEGTGNSDAVTKHQLQTGLSTKPNTNQVVLRDGSQDMTGNLNMSQKKIVNLADPTGRNDATGKGYVDRLFLDALRLDGSSKMTGNLDMSLNKIINCGQPTGAGDVTNKAYVDSEVGKTLKLDGSGVMTSVLDMNNQRIINLGNATHNQDAITLKQVNDGIATVSTENNKYTDQKILESHISTHANRKNVLSYAMDDGEFTEDFGIQDVTLIDFDDMPHKTNKKAFSMKVRRTTDGSNEYKGRFDFNLFKMYRDNKSDKYTVCVETYFQKSPFHGYEFESTLLGFEKLNMNIDLGTTIKVNSEYKYLRTILNLSPDGTSPSIQRRLYVNFKSNFDNDSPNLLPVFVLIYGIKGEAKSDLDMTIYDYEKATEVVDNNFQFHVPVNMNDHKITGLAPATKDTDAISKKFFIDNLIQPRITYVTTRNSGSKWTMKYGHLNDRGQNLQFPKIHINAVSISYHAIPQGNYRLAISFGTGQTAFFQFSYKGTGSNYISINRTFVNVTEMSIRTTHSQHTGGYVIHFHGNIEFNPGAYNYIAYDIYVIVRIE